MKNFDEKQELTIMLPALHEPSLQRIKILSYTENTSKHNQLANERATINFFFLQVKTYNISLINEFAIQIGRVSKVHQQDQEMAALA
jgi:hypothetical protein